MTSPHLFPAQASQLCHLSPQDSSTICCPQGSQVRPMRWGQRVPDISIKKSFA